MCGQWQSPCSGRRPGRLEHVHGGSRFGGRDRTVLSIRGQCREKHTTKRVVLTMKAVNGPETQATTFLRQFGVIYSSHLYKYEEHGGTMSSSRALNVDEHIVIKTLIMEDESAKPLIVLMHGDCKVSTKELARQAGRKKIEPCKPEVANRHTGFLVGGTSPFGTRKEMPVYVERSILSLPLIYINGGRRGYLVGISPLELPRLLNPHFVNVAII